MRQFLPAILKKDSGSALIAAVAGLLAFSYIGFEVLAADRGVIASVRGSTERARLAAAADAGIALALQNLMGDPASRWPIDGRVQELDFGTMRIAVAIEDERGKVPLNQLTEDQVRNLFATAGATGMRLDALTDAFEDWFDDDEDVRPLGAEDAYYAPLGMRPRNGELRSVEELAAVKGVDAALIARIAPFSTVWFGSSGGFSPSTAPPEAIAVVTGQSGGVDAIERAREAAGQQTALDVQQAPPLIGRTLTIRVAVSDSGAAFHRAVVVELTGDRSRPYWIHVLDP